jgi:site-specific DNA-adenine methylase
VFEEALDMKKQNYHGCSDIETAVYRKILTDQSYNAMCMTYRDIDKGDDVYVAIKAAQYRNRYTRQILPDCSSLSQELQGINIIEGDMFDYVEQLKNPGLWCTIDPPYRPSARAAGKKGYDQDWSEVTHQRLMEELWSMHMQQELKAKIMIFCYANLADLQNDLYCRYLLKMGFDLYLLKDIYLPKICSRRVHSKKKKMNTECIFINYEPVGGDIVGQGRRFTVKDVYGSDVI